MNRIEQLEKMEEMMPLIRELIGRGQSVRLFPRGISMLPMIRQGTDSVQLSPLPEQLKKYDVVLYRRDNGKYVLHRIVDVADTYTCVGDNQFVMEPGLRQDQMIAVVTAFYRGETMYHTTHGGYGIYCRIWHYTRPLRHFLKRGIGWIRRHLG